MTANIACKTMAQLEAGCLPRLSGRSSTSPLGPSSSSSRRLISKVKLQAVSSCDLVRPVKCCTLRLCRINIVARGTTATRWSTSTATRIAHLTSSCPKAPETTKRSRCTKVSKPCWSLPHPRRPKSSHQANLPRPTRSALRCRSTLRGVKATRKAVGEWVVQLEQGTT